MNYYVKLGCYVILIALAFWFGHQFYKRFSASSRAAASRNDAYMGEVRENTPIEPKESSTKTNSVEKSTNRLESLSTNAATLQSNLTVKSIASNSPAATTNATSTNETNAAVGTNEIAASSNLVSTTPPETRTETSELAKPPLPHSSANMIGYLGAFVGTMILLGLMIGNDVSHFFGSRAIEFVFNDDGEGMRNPEYEEAEAIWANGDHLEAIRLMRQYLVRNPREQYVALRIAEIYEKDLHNYLAAALEYEEVLKNKIEAERWGWAAIHLCNLYSKMGQTDKAVALLRRIDSEYGKPAR